MFTILPLVLTSMCESDISTYNNRVSRSRPEFQEHIKHNISALQQNSWSITGPDTRSTYDNNWSAYEIPDQHSTGPDRSTYNQTSKTTSTHLINKAQDNRSVLKYYSFVHLSKCLMGRWAAQPAMCKRKLPGFQCLSSLAAKPGDKLLSNFGGKNFNIFSHIYCSSYEDKLVNLRWSAYPPRLARD